MVGAVTAIGAMLGGLVGFGVVVLALGMRGTDMVSTFRPPTPLPDRRLSLRLALGVGTGLTVGLLTRWPVAALLAAALGFAGPGLVGGAAARRAAIARTEAIAAWTEMLRDTMAAAAGIEQAIMVTAPVAPAPIRAEVATLATRLERERLVPALRDFAQALADPTGDLVVSALVLASERQARRLGDLLGTLAGAAREHANMALRVEAGRARTRTAVRVITATTLAFALGLVAFNRGYLDPYDSVLGQVVLGLVGACFAGAFWWLATMAKVAAPERFLASSEEDRR
jgi:tight adherence protein B